MNNNIFTPHIHDIIIPGCSLIEKDDELAADRLKNAAATKKLCIMDAFEILNKIENEKALLDGTIREKKNNTPKGFAESRSR